MPMTNPHDPDAWALLFFDNSETFLDESDAGPDCTPVWVTNDRLEFTLIDREEFYRKPPRHWKMWSSADYPVLPPSFLYPLMTRTEFLLWRRT
jgi:hypothetical protein